MTHSDQVKLNILEKGLELYPHSTARAIGRELGMSHSAILYHFGKAELLDLDIARYAVAKGNAKVVVQLIASGHPAVADLTPAQKRKFMSSIG